MHQARSSLGAAVVNGKIYAIGGIMLTYQDSSRTEFKEVSINEEYDPATNTWTLKKPMPEPLSNFATAVYKGKIYCIGGGVSQFFNYSTGTWDTNLTQGINAVYDPETDTWETKAPMPIPQVSAQAHVIKDRIYVVGRFPSTLNEVYDPTTDTWTMKASSVDPIGPSTVVDDKIYCIGGDYKWRIYDPVTDSWSVGSNGLPDFLTGAYLVSTTGIMAPKRIYILYNPNHASSGWIYENQVYDPETDGWMSGAGVPTQRDDFAVAIVDDLIYVIGGRVIVPTIGFPISEGNPSAVTTVYGTVEVYTPFGYGAVPPAAISLVSPPNMANFTSTDIPLNFSTNKPTEWISYSLDGKDNVTVNANTTLTGLSAGWHNITVYAKDMNGNVGASETITFAINPGPLQATIIVPVACVSAAAAVVASLLYYRKKQRH